VEEFLGQISNIGFPIALSVYLLVRLEGKMERLSESINELAKTIGTINK
jgi:hypothetical protein